MATTAAIAAAVATGIGSFWYAYHRRAEPVHWSENEPDRTGRALRAAAALVAVHCVTEVLDACTRGLRDEASQRAAAVRVAHVLFNAYTLTDLAEALRLRRGYYDTGKDPPAGWPPVKNAVVWRALVADTIVLCATALVEASHGNNVAAAWRGALSSSIVGLLASNPLPFWTT